jgi:hypothetical protein
MPSSRGLFQKNMYFCIIFILTYNQSIQTMNKIKLFFCAILAAVAFMACNSTTGSIVGGTSGSIVGGILGSQISNNPLGSIVGSVAGSYGGSVVGSSIGSGKAFKKKARQLNKMYGLHVTPTIDLTTYKPRNDAPFLKRLYFRLIR